MKTALRLAAKGKGRVSPNPLVGAVIVKNGEIIGKGYHKKFGGNHAEINALSEAGDRSAGAILYCNLEPCSHHGKTPPCAEAVIRAGISKVIIGMVDPNPLVSGKGIRFMKENGIEVETGVLEKEAKELNEAFIKYITQKIPYVTAKMAQTLDSRISAGEGLRTQISGTEAQKFVHRLRTENDAVVVGKNTALIDDPLLTTRLVAGRTPKRFILDSNLEIEPGLKIFKTINLGGVWIVTSSDDENKKERLISSGVNILTIERDSKGRTDLIDFLNELGKTGVSSVLFEGGADVFSSLLEQELADKIIMIISPLFFGSGMNVIGNNPGVPGIRLDKIMIRKLGRDIIIEGKPVVLNG